MRIEVVLRYIGVVFIIISSFLFISFLLALLWQENTWILFLYSTLIALVLGFFPVIFVPKTDYLTTLEGVFIVVTGWISICILGMLPYILWGGEFSLINAWFESVSGFTTTGSSILQDVEALPKSLLFWRSSTHWLGGIGVIIYAILILPQSGSARLILMGSEFSNLAKSNFQYRTREIAKILVFVYFGLTLLETLALTLLGMSLFDAVNHTFATVATGGFSTRNASIAAFDNVGIEICIMIFMVLSGIHFGLIYNTIVRKKGNLFDSTLVRAYLAFIIVGIGFVSLKLFWSGSFESFGQSLRYGSFQVISLATTTGFASADSSVWPDFTQFILIYFTIQCAMAGSTSGGLKFDRVWIFFKSFGRQIKLLQHPRGVFTVKIDGKVIDDNLEVHTLVFIIFYILIIFVSTLILTTYDIDIRTAFSAAAATIGNVGPGFGKVSSLGNFSDIPAFGKFVLAANMLLGRLEIFGIISLFFRKTWW